MLILKRLAAGWSLAATARAMGTTAHAVPKSCGRFAAGGAAGLRDRYSLPRRSPGRLDARLEAQIQSLRRGRHFGTAIALQLRLPVSTVGIVPGRLGLGRLAVLHPPSQISPYERERPRELIRFEARKLGRIERVGTA